MVAFYVFLPSILCLLVLLHIFAPVVWMVEIQKKTSRLRKQRERLDWN